MELKLRNAEMGPRVTKAVSTGTISAAACRARSRSASLARRVAPALWAGDVDLLGVGAAEAVAGVVAAGAGEFEALEFRLQPVSNKAEPKRPAAAAKMLGRGRDEKSDTE